MATTYDTERQLQRDISRRVEAALPGVEVLAVELSVAVPLLRLHRPARGRRPRALRARHERPSRLSRPLHGRRLVAGRGAPAAQRLGTSATPSAARSQCALRSPSPAARRSAASSSPPRREDAHRRSRARPREHPIRRRRARQPDRRGDDEMTREIIEGIQTIEREKGIESGTLIEALEDALLAAYKKTPGATRHADRRARPGHRGLPRLLHRPARRHRGAARGGGPRARDPGARAAGGGDGRALARPRHRRGPQRSTSRTSPRTSSSARTSRRTTSAASPRRPRSRSSSSGSARRSAR